MWQKMGKRVAAYCRVSTATDEQLASLAEQESFFADYAAEHDMLLYRIYADGGRSGTRLARRSAFAEMMADARCGAFEVLLVKDISRMARNVLDFLQTVRTLKKLGIDCRFLTANCSAGDGELFLTILAAVAQEESANLSRRVKFTKDHHARLGRVPNRVYGYRREKGELFCLTIDEAESEVVRRIYDCALDGWGSRKIARLLATEGVLTQAGHLFSESSVRQILANPLYAGILRTHQTEVADYLTGQRRTVPLEEQYTFVRTDLAIVSEADWQAVQKRKKAARILPKTSGGKMVCDICRKAFRRRGQGADTVWSCATRSRLGKDACPNSVRVRERELTDALYTWLDAYITQPRWEKALRRAADPSSGMAEKMRERQRRRARQEALLLTGAIGRTEYLRRIELIDEETVSGRPTLFACDMRKAVLMHMVSQEVRGRWIESISVSTSGKLTVALRTPQMRGQTMLPDWETP